MIYQVRIGRVAQQAIEEAFWFIHSERRQPMNAARWLQGLYDAVAVLERMPHRCSLAPEHGLIENIELRQALYKSHRIIFTIRGSVVHVLEVRHGAMMYMSEKQLRQLIE